MGILLAMFVGSLLPAIFDWSDVTLVRDIGGRPPPAPRPIFPDLSSFGDLVPALIGPAITLAIVGLVQGAAVNHTLPNPDGSKSDPSGDFTGQGLANVTTGFFRGCPVGRSCLGDGHPRRGRCQDPLRQHRGRGRHRSGAAGLQSARWTSSRCRPSPVSCWCSASEC